MKTPSDSSMEKHKLVLLEVCSGEDAPHKVGILEAHDIQVLSIADGVGAVTGTGFSIYSEHKIYVPEEDLTTAKKVLEQPVSDHETYEWEVYKRTRKNEGGTVGRILMLITSMFFATLAYYALKNDEVIMAWVLGGFSVSFLLVLYFPLIVRNRDCRVANAPRNDKRFMLDVRRWTLDGFPTLNIER